MTATVALAIGLGAAAGTAAALFIRGVRQQRRYAKLDNTTLALYRRLQIANEALVSLHEQVGELAPAIIDAQRRWGFDLARWPQVQELVGDPSASSVSWWLLSQAPGIDRLGDGHATECFLGANGRANGAWVPPQLPDRP